MLPFFRLNLQHLRFGGHLTVSFVFLGCSFVYRIALQGFLHLFLMVLLLAA